MSDTIIYEYPLTEKIRCYLRIEQLSKQLHAYQSLQQPELFKPFFSALFTLAEQVDRGEFKKELLRDLDTRKVSLNQWFDVESIDKEQLNKLIKKIDSFNFSQAQPNKVHALISQDPLLVQIKNKQSLPGGGCEFDTPLLHYWQHLPQHQRLSDINKWLAPFEQTIEAVTLLLQLLRESSTYYEQVATDGFFQDGCTESQLVRIKVAVHQGCYPCISGYRNRYSIRFISWNEQPLHDINFALACC
ncbi:cell division protein ZapD [Psychrobium sp. 1_MG-2023]|uniref:cell division protein ZapD n=1 Tax=Psychrobium sp. 1_MG-2023 TaxID=3062624 RepID=UPI00273653DE|nr:cell division protein ZapD [Psychrobium sp. 1_MG-2023]MDP2562032.1 cell division protein ZapD [Psychrobium sp. 1_MG-2023]